MNDPDREDRATAEGTAPSDRPGRVAPVGRDAAVADATSITAAATSPEDAATSPEDGAARPAPRPRPIIERIGLAAVALLLAVLFGLMSVAAFVGGELFLAVMSGIGCLMVVWVGGLTLIRGR